MKKIIFTTTILSLLLLFSTGVRAEDPKVIGDANDDGVVNILDLTLIVSQFGKSIDSTQVPNPDVNGDGTVNIS